MEEKFPASAFDNISARAGAVKKEIECTILPEVQLFDKPREVSFLEGSDILTPDDFKDLIALEERIDAMIDRAVKRLNQTKVMKQILGQQAVLDQKSSQSK